ncbi:MAG: TolC family protein, partial [Candidatus Binataceae bacterium]
LVTEAMRSSPLLAATHTRWRALEQIPIQAATLPDPEVTVQNLAVGNPLPGNRLQTNSFAYFGYGFSQNIPFPGKLRLRASEAQQQADAAHAAYEQSAREIAESVRETYFNLFYLARTLTLLQRTHDQLAAVEHTAEAQYRLGLAQQQDVLKAQLELTALLKEVALTREQFEQNEAALKQILGREIDSPDVEIGAVTPTPFNLDAPRLRELAEARAPALKQAAASEARAGAALALARKGYEPDFTVAGMYQKTGAAFPDYYMLTLSARIPLYFWRRQTPAIKQAALDRQSARAEMRADRLAVVAAAENQRLAVQTTRRVMTLYDEGLIPQAQATVASALADYRLGKVDFQTLLSAVVDLLRLRQEYFRTLADHEIAIAKIQELIGNVQ